MLRGLPILLLLIGAVRTPAAQPVDTLRVQLFTGFQPDVVAVEPTAAARIYAEDFARPLLRLPAGAMLLVDRRGDELRLRTSQGTIFARWIRIYPEEGGHLRLTARRPGQTSGPFTYPGWIQIAPDPSGLQVLNHVALEDYVAAVLAREHHFDDLESTKALAVAIRTYTLRRLQTSDTLLDHAAHQMYEGIDRVTPLIREAVDQTRGEVLTYQGELIEAVYFAASGGHTANNEEVWDGVPQPYLRGQPDPYDRNAPFQHWEASVPRQRLLEILSRKYGTRITGFRIGSHSQDGRVATIELLRERGDPLTIRANEFRLLVNAHFGRHTLRSTFFTARRQGDIYHFEGKGFGHGVGLSQYGALEMSRQGYSYRDILAFYYPDTELHRYEAGALLAAGSPPEPGRPDDFAPPLARTPAASPESTAPAASGATRPVVAVGWSATPARTVERPTRRRIGW
ncbi:SpoIID/LytB domain-containing protein [Rhodothermus marinus]|uniref:SpoIID/LytB domain protein n=1 Tax=Rhodothermus marinus (strain ATCC 43812 / DSM 4252 / R-10) TaxID=518766 RepID=D0MDS2_RHOM4|nr:SpoIID/LytB domain-containing protein [Rhodothermus marinus]ACY49066.1 SpoIID/LytB domain protein [Rhodothermus marinus DSM 4252]